MHKAIFNLTAIAFAWQFVKIIDVILFVEQYSHRDVIHFRTSSTIKLLASCDFLKSLTKIGYKNGSIAFFNA